VRRRGARRVRRRDSRRPAAPRAHRGGRLGKAADDSSRIKRHGRSRARAYLAAERGRGPGAERRRDGVDGRHRKCLRERKCDAGARGARSISLTTLGSWPLRTQDAEADPLLGAVGGRMFFLGNWRLDRLCHMLHFSVWVHSLKK
jgi:hypothetical protein